MMAMITAISMVAYANLDGVPMGGMDTGKSAVTGAKVTAGMLRGRSAETAWPGEDQDQNRWDNNQAGGSQQQAGAGGDRSNDQSWGQQQQASGSRVSGMPELPVGTYKSSEYREPIAGFEPIDADGKKEDGMEATVEGDIGDGGLLFFMVVIVLAVIGFAVFRVRYLKKKEGGPEVMVDERVQRPPDGSYNVSSYLSRPQEDNRPYAEVRGDT